MKKIYLLLFFVTFSFFGQTSMTFTNNSYMYVKDAFVYAKEGVTLTNATNTIYLRREGQLLQGRTGANTNSGLGSLSVFQEGTQNEYAYNYWCAPVGNTTATPDIGSFGLSMLFRPTTNVLSATAAVQLPWGTYNGIANPLSIATRWIYTYDPGTLYSAWDHVGGASTILPGRGFSMKGTGGTDNAAALITAVGETTANNPTGFAQRYDFRGRANSGDINIPVLVANETLTGNPYPSAINLNYFLLENSGYTVTYSTGLVSGPPIGGVIRGEATFWEQQKTPPASSHYLTAYVGGYGTYVANNVNANSPGTYGGARWNTYTGSGALNTIGAFTGSTYPRMFTPIGQGFNVMGFGSSGNAVMKDIYRVFVKESSGNSRMERNSSSSVNNDNWDEIANVAGVDYTQFSKNEVPQIKIHTILNNLYSSEITAAFNPNTTDGYDLAMDGISNEILPNDTYFSINGTTDNIVINTLPFGIQKRLPITLKSQATSNFHISVGNTINFDENQNIYLYDNQTGLYQDIKNDFFEISLPQGVHSNRFEITFLNSIELGNTNFNASNFVINQNNNLQQLTISNPNLIDINAVKIYDVTGKLIFDDSKTALKNNYQFSTSSYSDGVYIVRVYSKDNKAFAQKVIVSNNSK